MVLPATFLYGYLLRYKWTFFPALFALILTAGLSLAFPYLLGSLIGSPSDALSGEVVDLDLQQSDINQTVLCLVSILFAQASVGFFRVQGFIKAGEAALNDIRQEVLSHLVKLPISFFHTHRSGELSARFAGDLEILREALMTTVPQFARQTVILIGGLLFIFCSSVKLSLFMLALIPIVVLAIAILGRTIKKYSRATQDALATSNVIVEEAISGIQELKCNGNEAFEVEKYSQALGDFKTLAYKGAKARALFLAFIIFALFGCIALVAWFGAGMLIRQEISTEEFTHFILFSIFVGASLGAMPEIFSQIQKTNGATERIREILALEPEFVSDPVKEGEKIQAHTVELKNVEFSYPSRPKAKVLNKVSLNVRKGERVAIVGSSGSGKSTLFQLLFKLYEQTSGQILFGGQEVGASQLQDLRSQLALVPQDVFLFGGSILENIRYGRPEASVEEVKEAAKQAFAHDFITTFESGYETLVGPRGVQLSGGQRQRIAIARAILKAPHLLLLDEATSALDAESEKHVQLALDVLMRDRTSIIIAHRLSTIKNCDHIYVLEHGEIVESGTHEELIAQNKRYKFLADTQFLAEV